MTTKWHPYRYHKMNKTQEKDQGNPLVFFRFYKKITGKGGKEKAKKQGSSKRNHGKMKKEKEDRE